MDARVEDDILVVRLDEGENFFDGLKSALEEFRVNSGLVLFGIGMLEKFTISDTMKGHITKTYFEDPWELIACHGTIAKVDDDISIHVHGSLGDLDKRSMVGGHIFDGEVKIVCEVAVRIFRTVKMTRELDEKTGKRLISF